MIAKVLWDLNYNASGPPNVFLLSTHNCFRNLSIKILSGDYFVRGGEE